MISDYKVHLRMEEQLDGLQEEIKEEVPMVKNDNDSLNAALIVVTEQKEDL